MVSTIRNIASRVFDHLETTSPMEVEQRVVYTQTILRGPGLNKYKAVLLECKQSVKDITGDK